MGLPLGHRIPLSKLEKVALLQACGLHGSDGKESACSSGDPFPRIRQDEGKLFRSGPACQKDSLVLFTWVTQDIPSLDFVWLSIDKVPRVLEEAKQILYGRNYLHPGAQIIPTNNSSNIMTSI